jgi:hypothetical protein
MPTLRGPSRTYRPRGTGARAGPPARSCTCAKALTETHPGRPDCVQVSGIITLHLCYSMSATRKGMQSKLGTPSRPLFRAAKTPTGRPTHGRRGGRERRQCEHGCTTFTGYRGRGSPCCFRMSATEEGVPPTPQPLNSIMQHAATERHRCWSVAR